MKRIVTFGELLLRLSPSGDCKIGQTSEFCSSYGGSEANVAIALASYGIPTSFVSRLPDNPIGHDALNTLRYHNVGTEHVQMTLEGRMGIYFLQPGYKKCSRICTYDRTGSSISLTSSGAFDWDKIFRDAEIFHFSGITPALSPSLQAICEEACKAAQRCGVLISCDINYRSKLWTKEQAASVMRNLCRYADILFINEEEASLLGVEASGETLMQMNAFAAMVEKLRQEYQATLITTVARVPMDSFNFGIQAALWSSEGYVQSDLYPLHQVIDPNGAGDAYAAALLYGFVNKLDRMQMVNLAAGACNLKHSCVGDVNLASLNDIQSFVANQHHNGVQR